MQISAKSDMYRKHAELVKGSATDYFDVPQWIGVELVSTDAVRILEVGCGRGMTLLTIKQRQEKLGKTCEVVGVDISEDAFATAKERLDAAYLMDAEDEDFTAYPPGYFDVIIIIHVLEHVVNPWVFLRKWLRYLKVGGHLVIGVPNVSCYKFLKRLVLHDEFVYEPAGVLDWTHLRFFTNHSLRRILQDAGLEVEYNPDEQFNGKTGFLCKIFPPFKKFVLMVRRFKRYAMFFRARKVRETELEDYMPFEKTYTL